MGRKHTHNMRRTLCSKLFMMRAWRSIYTYTYIQWECSAEPSICVKSCMTQEFHISPRFSPTIFDPDANSVFLRAHLCTAVDPMRRKPCVRNCSREREGLHNGNVQQNPFPSLPAYDFLSRCKFSTPSSTPLYSSINRLYTQNPVFAIVHDESVKSV